MGVLSTLTLGTKKPLHVAAYCRVSTEQELQGESFENQKAFFRKEIMEHPDWQMVAVYGDLGKTGTSTQNRISFQRMMKLAENGGIDYIITKSISRFSRSITDTIRALRTLKEKGVGVYFLEQGMDSLSEGGDMVLDLMASIAEMESQSISENMKATYEAMNEMGTPVRKCCYGYEKDGTDWRINPAEAIRVRLAFLMAAEGFSFSEIAGRLNQFEEKDQSDREWNLAKVRYLLTNEAYIGDIMTNKTMVIWNGREKKKVNSGKQIERFYIKAHHEPLVGRLLFNKVSEMCKAKELAGQPCFRGIEAVKELARFDEHVNSVRKYLPRQARKGV